MAEEQVADAPVVETGEAPSDWKASLPDDIKNNSLIHNMDDVETLAKTAIHAQSMVGAEKIAIPGNWANDDDWNGVYTKLGRPEAAEGYDLKNPEGTEAIDGDIKSWYQDLAHDAGLNNRQAQKIYEAYIAKTGEMAPVNEELSEQDIEIQKSETEVTLKKEWGKAFDQKLDEAKGILEQFAPEGFAEIMTKDGVALGNSPEFIKTMANIGNYINSKVGEDKIIGAKQTPSLTPEDAQKEIAMLRGDPKDKGPYWNNKHPDHAAAVAEVSRLMEYLHPEVEE
tara:strand:+ start:406 stop:1251 length:846 start_codon:yes stop_codon:yes gene_type:complete